METGILRHISTTSQTDLIGKMTENANNKIPEYATNYKKEYLFIRGINKEFEYFVDYMEDPNREKFCIPKVDRFRNIIKRFLRAQEKGRLQDISDFKIDNFDVYSLIRSKKILDRLNINVEFVKFYFHEDDRPFVNPYPGLEDIYEDFNLFYSKLRFQFKFEEDSDSDIDYDSDIDDF